MATAYVTIGPVGAVRTFLGTGVKGELVTTSATAASGAIIAKSGDFARITCATAVYARSGGTVTPATGIYCPAGWPTDIEMSQGSVISLIDVA